MTLLDAIAAIFSFFESAHFVREKIPLVTFPAKTYSVVQAEKVWLLKSNVKFLYLSYAL